MQSSKRWLTLVVLALALTLTTACPGGRLDDDADVVMLITAFQSPPVSASADPVFGCLFTVTDWSVTIDAKPKNSVGGQSPFNDIVLQSVDIAYAWDNTTLPTTPTRNIGLGGVAIPAGGSAAVTFAPIGFTDLGIGNAGESASLTLTFNARTVEGTGIAVAALKQLLVESCVTPPVIP